jgi:hypothetical protein
VPPALAALVMKMMAKAPAARPRDMAAVAAELRRIEITGPAEEPRPIESDDPIEPLPWWRRPSVWAAAAVLAGLAVVGRWIVV